MVTDDERPNRVRKPPDQPSSSPPKLAAQSSAAPSSAAARPRRAPIERRQAAILALDVAGYSALMGQNEEETHLRVGADLARIARSVERLSGQVFAVTGDGILADFARPGDALQCAQRIQADAARRNAALPPNSRIAYRIGLGYGQIVVDGDRLGGTIVNIAARLEKLARPGGIALSQSLYDQLAPKQRAPLVPTGTHRLKNIRDPVTAYELPAPPDPTPTIRPTVAPEDRTDALDIAEQRPSLAVLPFRTLRRGGQDAYFAAGMVDDIIRVLGGLRHLVVVSRTATLSYGAASPDPGRPDLGKIGRELDVRYILHGSVQRSGKSVRLTVELDDAATAQTIWADTFDGDLARIFELQDQIAVQTASAIAPHLRGRELQRSLRKTEQSVTAYDLCLRALSRFYGPDNTGNRAALDQAETLLRRASTHDRAYATPHAYLAYLHILRLARGWSADDHAERLAAYAAAGHAAMLDGSDPLALAIHGHLHGYLYKDHDAALALLDQAVAISPSSALAWCFGSLTSGILGNTADALDRATRASRLAPIGPEAGPWHEHALSQAHYLAGNFDEAIEWGRIAAKHGSQGSNLRCLAAACVAADRIDDARAVASQLLAAYPHFTCGTFRAYTPLKGAVADLFVDRLRQAGLPG